MSRPPALVVAGPGTNRDRDLALALERAGADPKIVLVADLVARPAMLDDARLVAVAGGFSYGDALGAGRMLALDLKVGLGDALARFVESGRPLIGICNGFQVLTETGLLPGALLRNASLKYVCRDVHLRVETSQTVFTCGYEAGQVVRIPVAHGDGQYFADEATLDRLEGEGRIAFRYCEGPDGRPSNPNGSARDIAGVFNETRTVLGMMPHPERACEPAHGNTDGRAFFEGLVRALS